jgi:hypothetical protein
MWYQERKCKSKDTLEPKFQMCCATDKVQLPPLKKLPSMLKSLMFDQDSPHSKLFQQNMRIYNAMFSFTSPGMQIDKGITRGRGPPTIRIQGQTCHRIGTMLPNVGEKPKYAQLYIYMIRIMKLQTECTLSGYFRHSNLILPLNKLFETIISND